eukprot:1141479-Pelagomonas_calceolata.AAC.5
MSPCKQPNLLAMALHPLQPILLDVTLNLILLAVCLLRTLLLVTTMYPRQPSCLLRTEANPACHGLAYIATNSCCCDLGSFATHHACCPLQRALLATALHPLQPNLLAVISYLTVTSFAIVNKAACCNLAHSMLLLPLLAWLAPWGVKQLPSACAGEGRGHASHLWEPRRALTHHGGDT